jgi:hypothetical protein
MSSTAANTTQHNTTQYNTTTTQHNTMLRSRPSNRGKASKLPLIILGFLVGCITSATFILNFCINSTPSTSDLPSGLNVQPGSTSNTNAITDAAAAADAAPLPIPSVVAAKNPLQPLQGIRILIAIAAYDFSQLPHLEEVLDAYQDLCVSGAAKVDVVVHATIAYPVTLIDLFNSRLLPACKDTFSITIVLKPPSLRLHLVDCHRTLFYQRLDQYDLFIYTEDDIRVSPRTVAAYLSETYSLQNLLKDRHVNFNVGIVRYEYNYPSNVLMDDKTRHATQNVTRVYWEHGQYPIFPKSVEAVTVSDNKKKEEPLLQHTHITMHNHHQGMFLATRELLQAWKVKPGCDFATIRNRPSVKTRPSQPSEGTQRVWMSSQMLYGSKHCNVQQVLPITSFGSLTVLHLPNKNYRRVGHFRNRTFSDGTEKFETVSSTLLTAMRLHLEIAQHFPFPEKEPYWGVQMLDEVDGGRTPLLERRMGEYQAYVDRGGVLSEQDVTKTDLVEER